MIKATLKRITDGEDQALGVLLIGEHAVCLTLELPWRNNEKNISQIPEGKYICRMVDSPKFGKTFEVCDVPNRGHILFHKGNYARDTQGCILLGSEFDVDMIKESSKAFKKFMGWFTEDFELEIV